MDTNCKYDFKIVPSPVDGQINSAKSGQKINLGSGLYLQVNKKGDKRYFQKRVSLGGKDTTKRLGEYPAMSIAQAREKASLYDNDVIQGRQKRSDEGWGNFVAVNSKKKFNDDLDKYPSFRRLSDAAEFIRDVRAPYRACQTEIRLAIYLQMLIPWRAAELLDAKRRHINIEQATWSVLCQKHDRTQLPYDSYVSDYLSKSAFEALNQLCKYSKEDDYVFPSLGGCSKREKDKLIAQEIKARWTKYTLHPAMHKNFFLTTAIKESGFTQEFIMKLLRGKNGKGSIYNDSAYDYQRRALAYWWDDKLIQISSIQSARSSYP